MKDLKVYRRIVYNSHQNIAINMITSCEDLLHWTENSEVYFCGHDVPFLLFVCWNGSLLWSLHCNICCGESAKPLKIWRSLHYSHLLGMLCCGQISSNICGCQDASNLHNASQFCFLSCWSISACNLGRQVPTDSQGNIVYSLYVLDLRSKFIFANFNY